MAQTALRPGGQIKDPNGVVFTGVVRVYYSNTAISESTGNGLSCNGAYIRYDVDNGTVIKMFMVTGTHAVNIPVGDVALEVPITIHVQYIYTTNYDSEGYKCFNTSLSAYAANSGFFGGTNLGDIYPFLTGREQDRRRQLDAAYASCSGERASLLQNNSLLTEAALDANNLLILEHNKLLLCEHNSECLVDAVNTLTAKVEEQDNALLAAIAANNELVAALNELDLIDRTGNLAKCLEIKTCLEQDLFDTDARLVSSYESNNTLRNELEDSTALVDSVSKENTELDTKLANATETISCLERDKNSLASDLATAQLNINLLTSRLEQTADALTIAEEVEYKTQLEKCQADYECLQRTDTDLKTKIEELNEEIKVLKFDKNNLELALTFAQEIDYQKLYADEQDTNKCLKYELMITSNNLKDVLSQLANAEARLVVANQLLSAKDIEANTCKTKLTAAESKLACAGEKTDDDRANISELTTALAKATADLASATATANA
ncbi:MAG: hypothetical protein ACRCZ9_09580, partial [Fusobacteriaceae bacterium]